MLFTKLISLVSTISVASAIAVAEADSLRLRATIPSAQLDSRALPPCDKNDDMVPGPSDADFQNELAQNMVDAQNGAQTLSVCKRPKINCVYVQNGISEGRGGFGRAARIDIGNGNFVEVYRYYQSTIQWVTQGGSVNSYMAHGVDYVCVKGVMSVVFANKKVLRGDDNNSDSSIPNCHCHYPLDDDKTLYPYQV